jgi:hypothetical protein
MKKLFTNRQLIIINFTIVFFFSLIWVINFYKIDTQLIGVFRELLTLPFFIAQIIFFVIGIKFLIINQRKRLTVISVLSLAICMFITIGSFF